MFRNLNAGIIKRLAANSLRSDKKRNLFLILTIAFSACLMLTLSLKILGQNTKLNRYLQGRYQTVFSDLSAEKVEELQNRPEVERAGIEVGLGTPRIRDYVLSIEYADAETASLLTYGELEGSWPEAENEIIIESGCLKHLGLPVQPGQTLNVDLGDGVKRDYTVSGVMHTENETRVYRVIVSGAYLNAVTDGNPKYSLNIRLRGTEGDDMDALKEKALALAEACGVKEQQVFYSSTYFTLGEDLPIEKVLGIAFCCILIVVATSLVIYSLFYISVVAKTQEYGRLRVIGTTKRQIKKLVRREGLFVSGIAIPAGILLGSLLGFLLEPEGWKWSISILCMAVIAVLTEAAVMISIRTPVKIASSVSPVEAVRISEVSTGGAIRKKERKQRRITPVSLAFLNFGRNRRKVVLTLCSLGFTGILLMCAASYLNSVDADAMARAGFGVGCVHIELEQGDNGAQGIDVDSATEYYTRMEQDNPLNEEMLRTLSQIDGVTDVAVFRGCKSDFIFPRMNDYARENLNTLSFRNIGLSREQMEKYSGMLLEGTIDYDTLVKERGVLVGDSEKLMYRFYGYLPQLGDVIQVKTDQGTVVELKVMGLVDSPHLGIDVPFFYVPDALLPLLKESVDNFNTHYMVEGEPEKEMQIEEAVIDRMEEWEHVEINFLSDIRNQMQKSMDQFKLPLYGLVVFIALFGILNLVNTLLTNVVTRRQEFGILQSVGMSGGQLSAMLKAECLFYVAGTLLLTLTVGTAAGWALCRIFDQLGTFGKLVFHFPFAPVLVFAALLLVIQMVFSVWAVRYCQKESLVQRIKSE
ncbi:ABC transporter permease [Eisenbergiella sp.]